MIIDEPQISRTLRVNDGGAGDLNGGYLRTSRIVRRFPEGVSPRENAPTIKLVWYDMGSIPPNGRKSIGHVYVCMYVCERYVKREL